MTAYSAGGTKDIEVAESFVRALGGLGVDYIFMNTGSDSVPVIENMAKLKAMGLEKPIDILCPYEGVAVSMAEGYAMVTGKPQLVFVHADVGTQSCGSALHNVLRDRVPLVLCAGITPAVIDSKVPGSRDIFVQWMQDTPDQSLILRDYVKWFYQVRSAEHLPYALVRAFQTANATPEGPTYLMLPREVLMEKRDSLEIPDPARYPPPSPPQADPEALMKAARALVEAEAPVIVTSYMGRRVSAVKPLIELSELLAAAVVEPKRCRTNFFSTHPNYQGRRLHDYLEKADVILLVDVDAPWLPYGARRTLVAKIREDAQIIQIDTDPLKERIPLWGFPADISMSAESSMALPSLNAMIKQILPSAYKERIANRGIRLKDEHEAQHQTLIQAAREGGSSKPIEPSWLFYVLNKIKGEDSLIVDDSVSNSGLAQDYVDTTVPGTYFGVGGSSMGWGLPAALGAKLARRDKTVITVTGDGSFTFANPVAGLWVAKHYGISVLTVILNNQGYAAVKSNLLGTYPEGASKVNNMYIGIEFDEPPNYAAIAQACGVTGITAEDPESLEEVLSQGLEKVSKGQSVVVDVRLKHL